MVDYWMSRSANLATSSIAPTRTPSLIRHYTFSAATFLLQILVVDGTLSSRHLSHAHFTYSVAEVDFEVHVLHGVNASLVDGRRGDFISHLKLRSQEVFCPESNAAFLSANCLFRFKPYILNPPCVP